jgi:Skp family chaperone for outer membrane proteins
MRLFSLAFMLAVSGCASAGASVAFANLQVAVRECGEGREARAELMQTFRSYQERLDRRREELVEERARIAASRAHGEDVQARQAAFQQLLTAVHHEYTKLQKDLSEAELRRADLIRSRLKAILHEQARARGITVVSDSDVALNDGRRYVDLTADVIRAADATKASHASGTNASGGRP